MFIYVLSLINLIKQVVIITYYAGKGPGSLETEVFQLQCGSLL